MQNRVRMWRASAMTLAAAMVALGVAGCAERLDNSAACPLTCTDQSAQIQTVTLDVTALDSTVTGGLGKGTESQMLLANRGDTLDTRVIIRFDTIPGRSVTSSTDTTSTPVQRADSAMLLLTVDSTAAKQGVPLTVSLFDVASTAPDDTSATALEGLFTPARLITSQSFAPGTFVDTVKISIPPSVIVAKAQAGARLRIGLQISSPSRSVSARIASSETSAGPKLRYRTVTDTAVPARVLVPFSATPSGNSSIASSLGDFTLVVIGTPPVPTTRLAVGGLPGARAYLRFNIPSRIVDSSLVIRATLLLTQTPSASPDPTDTMTVQPYLVLAGAGVSDPLKAAQIIAPVTVSGTEPLKLLPGTAGVREAEIGQFFKFWAVQTEAQLPRAIALVSAQEDFSPQQALFYSSNATDPTVRPKLRISYTLRSRIGLP